MIRSQKTNQKNIAVVIAIGSISLIVFVVVIYLIISAIGSAFSAAKTPLPAGFAETAIAETLAAFPTDTPLPTSTPTNTPLPTSTPLPTNTPTLIPTPTRIYIPASQPTECTKDPEGKCISAAALITPVSVKGECDCEATNITCKSFRTAYEAQVCYDWCQVQTCSSCTKNIHECGCDPWGLDAADGEVDLFVCGYGDPHLK
jgi:hypothetical protein